MQHQRRLATQQKQIFKKASRTYYGATRFFPRAIRQDVYTLYAFVRIADDFVDTTPQDATALAAFRDYYEALRAHQSIKQTSIDAHTTARTADLSQSVPSSTAPQIAPDTPNKPRALSHLQAYTVEQFVHLCERVSIQHEWVLAFLDVMRSDLVEEWRPKETMNDTLRYMYGSAEVIGLMMARVLHLPSQADTAAKRLGRAMQYANFIRDIKEDTERKRQYFPQTELQAHNLTHLHNTEGFPAFIQAQIGYYMQWQAEAEQGFRYLPSACRVAVKTASDMYTWTVESIAQDPRRVWNEQIKPTPWQVIKRGLTHSWSERLSMARWLLKVSRPRFWLYLGGTYLVGAAAGAESYNDLLQWQPLLHLAFFLVPANVLLYGINDVFDEDTDQYNTKKDGAKETRVTFATKSKLWTAVMFSLLGGITLFFWETSQLESIVLGAFFILAIAYSAHPLRFKARPWIDSLSNVLYILPGILGYLHTSTNDHSALIFSSDTSIEIALNVIVTGIPWLALAAGWCWAASMHLFSAIPDIKADAQAGLRTTAITLGRKGSLIACSILWVACAALLAALAAPWWILVMACVYPLIPLSLLIMRANTRPSRIARVYWIFPWLNGFVGFLLFVTAIIKY